MQQRTADVVVVGAGFSGLYALHRMRELGYTATLVEAGDDVGGTWYWNRYPGCRVDTESLDYSYSFSEELQAEWKWTERYAGQPEIHSYLRHVATRFDLWSDIELNTRIDSATWDDTEQRWQLRSTDGRTWDATNCILATGFLSVPLQPRFDGLSNFNGTVLRSTEWPEDGFDFTGKRVGIIGTGSTGVQMMPIIAKNAGRTTVFQRTPAYSVPLRNVPLEAEFDAHVKSMYPEWRRLQRESGAGAWSVGSAPWLDRGAPSAMDVTEQERLDLYEECWQLGGINGFYMAYGDLASNLDSNETLAEFLREKIRERIGNPEVADKLVPQFPVMTKRLCADTGYFEAYRLETVDLVDVNGKTLKFDESGIEVDGEHYDLDVAVVATGFDAVTGAMTRLNIVGQNGETLQSHWSEEYRNAAGFMSAGFPNLFWINGPGSPAADSNPVLMAEDQMGVIGDLIDNSRVVGEPVAVTAEMEDEWLQTCDSAFAATLRSEAKSWYNGGNVPGKVTRGMMYHGGDIPYLQHLAAYEAQILDQTASTPVSSAAEMTA